MKGLLVLALICVLGAHAQTIVLSEEFTNGIPTTWSLIDNDNNTVDASVSEYTEAWIAKADPENNTDTVASSTSFFSPIDRADRWLITPGLDLGTFGNLIAWQTKSHDPSYPEDYKVLISTTDTQISSFTDTLALVSDATPFWTEYEFNLSDLGYNGSTIYVAFVLTTFDGFKLYLDDVLVTKEDPVSVDEIYAESSISCYPNPTSDLITVKSEENLSFSVHTLNGKEVKTGTTNTPLSIAELENGIYMVRVLIKDGVAVKRIVKVGS